MIKQAYLSLLRFGPARRSLRAARAGLQQLCGYSDPFYDLADIANRSRAAIFLDIGCHHGDTLLRFIEAGVRCPIAAFDPSADNLNKAKALLQGHGGIVFHELAVSDADGMATFHLNKNEQTSSLLPNAAGNLASFPEDTMNLGACEVPTIRLDSWTPKHCREGQAIVKCDTQGAEGAVIRGGLRFLREQVAAFYGEVMLGQMYEGQSSFEEIRHLLETECGLVLKNIYPCLHDNAGRAVQMDVLWVKPEYL